jgi:hypothetical protein
MTKKLKVKYSHTPPTQRRKAHGIGYNRKSRFLKLDKYDLSAWPPQRRQVKPAQTGRASNWISKNDSTRPSHREGVVPFHGYEIKWWYKASHFSQWQVNAKGSSGFVFK